MSLYGVLNSSIAGMAAQSNRIGSIADNISNSGTTGYKRTSTEFETVLGQSATSAYAGGSVATNYRASISEQGALQTTSNPTDLAINGSGFFLVTQGGSSPVLTRAGSFQPTADGFLENVAGYRLMGIPTDGRDGPVTSADLQRSTAVKFNQQSLAAQASTGGKIAANVPAESTSIAAGQLPSVNAADAAFTAKTSITAYDNLGARRPYDIYFTKTGPDAWEVSAFVAESGGFPYSAGPVATATVDFDPATGALSSDSPSSLAFDIPGGKPFSLDLGSLTQLAADYSVSTLNTDGHAPVAFDHIEIGPEGLLSNIFQDGSHIAAYRIPLAGVVNPNGLLATEGNSFVASEQSGNIMLSAAGEGSFGKIIGSSLESSTVDLAGELTNMIQAQRSYTINSKVFQAGSDLLEIISNLKV